jgi:hypothetical protein
MRYLGIAMGMAVVLGFCAAFGTLVPPVFAGDFGKLLATASGLTVLAGVAACLLGIAVSGAEGGPEPDRNSAITNDMAPRPAVTFPGTREAKRVFRGNHGCSASAAGPDRAGT